MKKIKRMEFETDFTKAVEVLTWRATAIDWRQGLKSYLTKMSILKLAFQQVQTHYEIYNEEGIRTNYQDNVLLEAIYQR